MGSLPALTYTIHHSTDRLRRQHLYYEQEIIKTRQLMMGDETADANLAVHYGVVSSTDPATHAVGSTFPLAVAVNAQNQLTLDVNPGTAVMKSGCWIELNDIVRQVAVAETGVNIPNVVYLQYLLDSAPSEPNRFDDPVVPYTVRVGDVLDSGVVANTQDVLIGVLGVDAFNQLADSVKQDLVPLAVVTVQVVDLGGGVFNRPWFSIVDQQHRNQVGTGTVTDTNPHATSGNDLTIGDLSILQLNLDHGMVIAKDRSIAKVPGYRCTSAITEVKTDDALGTLTGFASASYIELPYFPVRVGRVWLASTDITLAALHVQQTHRIVFPYEVPTAGEIINVYYTRAEVAEPPLPGNNTFVTNGPSTQELAIAGGLGLVSLTTTEETFADAYQIPMRYEMFMDGEGALLKTPQVVYCWKRLDDLGTSDSTIDITPYGPGRLIMALSGAGPGATLDIQVRVYGTDAAGATIDELFTFTQADWNDVPAIPALPSPSDDFLKFSDTVFATITNVTVEVRSDGPNSAIMIWMAQHAFSNYDKQADALHVATVDWNGYGFGNVYDKRVVAPTMRDEQNAAADSKLQALVYRLVAGGNFTVYVDDFRNPQYHSLETPDDLNETASHYPTYNFSKQQVGLHGYYRSIAFPVHANSGTTWRVSLFGAQNLVDAWFPNQPRLQMWTGGPTWSATAMTAVPGVPNTWEVTLASVPTRVQVLLYPGQCTGMAIYG